jgi:hypothetical protein
MSDARKPQVGDRLVIKPIGNNARNGERLSHATVVNVRRKLFAVQFDGWRDTADFYIDSMRDNAGQYTASWRAYFSEQEIADERRASELSKHLSEMFKYGRVCYTLDQLERITAITNEGTSDD